MKNKIRDQYLIDDFVDFTGETREFILCAITEECLYFNNTPCKYFYVGLSVRNHGDVYNEETGKKIAKTKANSNPIECMTAIEPITFNTDTVNALLHSYAEYFKKDPGIFLKSYNEQKKEYEKDPQRFLEKRKFHEDKERKIKQLEQELKKVKESRFTDIYAVHKTR